MSIWLLQLSHLASLVIVQKGPSPTPFMSGRAKPCQPHVKALTGTGEFQFTTVSVIGMSDISDMFESYTHLSDIRVCIYTCI